MNTTAIRFIEVSHWIERSSSSPGRGSSGVRRADVSGNPAHTSPLGHFADLRRGNGRLADRVPKTLNENEFSHLSIDIELR
jgi:hypothetical protein